MACQLVSGQPLLDLRLERLPVIDILEQVERNDYDIRYAASPELLDLLVEHPFRWVGLHLDYVGVVVVSEDNIRQSREVRVRPEIIS